MVVATVHGLSPSWGSTAVQQLQSAHPFVTDQLQHSRLSRAAACWGVRAWHPSSPSCGAPLLPTPWHWLWSVGNTPPTELVGSAADSGKHVPVHSAAISPARVSKETTALPAMSPTSVRPPLLGNTSMCSACPLLWCAPGTERPPPGDCSHSLCAALCCKAALTPQLLGEQASLSSTPMHTHTPTKPCSPRPQNIQQHMLQTTAYNTPSGTQMMLAGIQPRFTGSKLDTAVMARAMAPSTAPPATRL